MGVVFIFGGCMYPRRFPTPESMYAEWEKYKDHCANYEIDYGTRNGIVKLKKPMAITVEGFCAFAKISKQRYYHYKDFEEFTDVLELIETEHEAYINAHASTGEIDSNWFKTYAGAKLRYASQSVVTSHNGLSAEDKTLLEKAIKILEIREATKATVPKELKEGEPVEYTVGSGKP